LRAPNLTRAAASWSDAELDGALRHGIRRDGRALWVMPSSAFARMSDADSADILAYVRSRPAGGPELARSTIGPMGRLGIVLGKFHSEPEMIRAANASPVDLGPAHARGRYLTVVACGECHGPALKGGGAPLNAPDLMIAASYDLPTFTRFMRTGVAADGRQRKMMSGVARARFSSLTDEEVGRIHAYLTVRAERTP
jgi:mono/diheme cytochrome c family protein